MITFDMSLFDLWMQGLKNKATENEIDIDTINADWRSFYDHNYTPEQALFNCLSSRDEFLKEFHKIMKQS